MGLAKAVQLEASKSGQDIERAAQALREGLLVGLPTETVYGLGANAWSESALRAVFAAKRRPFNDPLILHTSAASRLGEIAAQIPPQAMRLAEAFWPGPLTLLLPRTPRVPNLVTAGLPTVAVRIPDHPLTLELLRRLEFPVAAPSANPFGYISPTTAAHVFDQLGDAVAYVLDGGPCRLGLESTIVGFDEGIPTVYRLGSLNIDQLVRVVGRVGQRQAAGAAPPVPGALPSHYAPRTPLQIGHPPQPTDPRWGWLSLKTRRPDLPPANQIQLSAVGDLEEAARNLYAALRYLDSLNLTRIYAEPMPDSGLGLALNDRLRRAAAAH